MICAGCGAEYDQNTSTWCPECQARVREAARHVDALQQICADRPDLVHYLEGLLNEVVAAPGERGASALQEPAPLSPAHVRWRALIGKARPHFERCKDWQVSEKALSRSGEDEGDEALEPQPDWTDEELKIHVIAVEGGDLTVEAGWFYGPAEGGLQYLCKLVVSGWDHMIHINWLTRSIYTLFFCEPQITVVRHDGQAVNGHGDPDSPETLGELG